jgi:pyruvate formate-lyase activating enzyme-like uncharacterized protein
MKTPYSSYYFNDIAKGCKYCVKGKKLVLFISGICSRNCNYCSLSEKRKNKDLIWVNERPVKKIQDLTSEVKESNATSAGITGGDPLLFCNRTLKYAKILKQKFKKNFHIHIYLPTKLVTKEKLKKLSKYIDEVRFNPEISMNYNKKNLDSDIEKIKLARLFWAKRNIGVELPMIPDKKEQFLEFILKICPYIGFVNFNEFELSETNYNHVTKKYKLNPGGYTIKGSIKSGLWLLKEFKKRKTKLKIHLCCAELKNSFQFKNRLLCHKILPYGMKTSEGTVKYIIVNYNTKKELENFIKILKNQYYIDKAKKRIIIPKNKAKVLLSYQENFAKFSKQKIFLIEEFPTYDRIETEKIECQRKKQTPCK